MKQILFFFVFCSSILISQNVLTYGQVYNFDVGDIIQGQRTASPNSGMGSTAFLTNKIVGKVISVNNDSIVYTIQQTIYTPPTCQTCSATTTVSIITQTITSLNSPVPNVNSTTCYSTDDTSYVAYNNRNVYEVHTVYDTIGCFEPNTEITKYVEGVGKFFRRYVGAAHFGEDYELVYYIKQNGTYGPTAIESAGRDFSVFTSYPNPSNSVIHLESTSLLNNFTVADLNGKICLSGVLNSNEINIEKLPVGVYMLQISTMDFRSKTIRLIKN